MAAVSARETPTGAAATTSRRRRWEDISLLACALLGCLALIAYLSWSLSPRFTIAGAGLLSLLLAHGARQTFRTPAKGRRRGLAALTAVGFTVTAMTALFLLLYSTGCECL
ncbi:MULTISPECIES: lysine transporter LysE [unclassified Streptomyces]|uniref:lysine transporter LysE n=1 Tax=unclassified Streptomyces TaxID=2593676 RepID=UPI0033CE7F0B